jgi:hypothetical protein
MTEAIEQEALAMFASELATFLAEAIARLDSLGAKPTEQLNQIVAEQPPEKPAKKPRKKKAAPPLQVEAVGEAADLAHLVDAVGDPVDGPSVLGGQASDPTPAHDTLQLDHREQTA